MAQKHSIKPKTVFLHITCPRCHTRHIIYGKSSIKVKCKKCNKLLVRTSGGKVQVRAPVKEVLCH